MKRLALAFAILLLALPAAAYYSFPHWFAQPPIELNRHFSGLTKKSLRLGTHDIHYLEGGHGPTVVLLHGIFAEKDHWVDFARQLTDRYHVIAPDLPGYGQSSRLHNEPYDYAAQTARLHTLFDALGIERAHIAGNSMGGTLAALFAVRHPERASSVAFIGAPHGIRSPRQSEMDGLIDAGKAPLIARNEAEFEHMLSLLFVERPFLPYPILHASRAAALHNAASNQRLWQEQLKHRYLLQQQLRAVRVPVLALWGSGDLLFHVSGTEVLRAQLPHADVQVLPGVGHLPMMEAPAKSARIYANFISMVGCGKN